jgi:hypothetical protein
MKSTKVTRYNCDFCNKRGFSAPHMAKHEKHCTLNPNRECRVCNLLINCRDSDFQSKPLAELIAILPDSAPFNAVTDLDINREHEKLTAAVIEAIPALRKAAGDCPACMMAALRLARIPVPMAENFDFKKEMDSFMEDLRAERDQSYYY